MDRATTAVTAGRPTGPGAVLNTPPVLASTFRDGGEIGYGRHGNPSWQALEEAVAALEQGAGAVAFSSGQAASAAVLAGLPTGARVIGPAVGYLGTRALLAQLAERGAIAVQLVEVTDTAAVIDALTANGHADLLWLESPTNPLLGVADLPALCGAARQAGTTVVVDSTFATPLRQRPLNLGADLVVHSATKFIGGHSDLLLGLVVAAAADDVDRLRSQRTLTGAVPGTAEAFLTLRGLRTLDVRLARAEASAGELVRRLREHPGIAWVHYPGLADSEQRSRLAAQSDGPGAVLAFETTAHDARQTGEKVLAGLQLIVATTSLGGVETTLDLRVRWPGEDPRRPGLLRMSVGLENVDDIWADLRAALDAALADPGADTGGDSVADPAGDPMGDARPATPTNSGGSR